MKRLVGAALLLLFVAGRAGAATDRDLSGRIGVDGITDDFTDDEWVVDSRSSVPERGGDSHWGTDNDLRRLAVTWDDGWLYIAIDVSLASTTLMLYLDTTCGMVSGLVDAGLDRRIEFGRSQPNLILGFTRTASEPVIVYGDCDRPLEVLEADAVRAVLRQDPPLAGALEVAVPWELLGSYEKLPDGRRRLPARRLSVRLFAAVTGGPATGSGDAIPDPSSILDGDSTRTAVLDNAVIVPLDADGDALLDAGVRPRDVVRFQVTPVVDRPVSASVRLELETKLFSPDRGEQVRFRATVEHEVSSYVTADVYSSTGKRVRRLVVDELREEMGGIRWDTWDGRDDRGSVVAGGVYVIVVSAGPAPGTATGAARGSVAVVR